MSKQRRYDVVISGGGFAGVSMAIALARQGMQVAVIEKALMDAQLEAPFDGRVSAIALGSKNILENIGAWEGMRAYAEPILDIRVSDGDTPFFLHYDHAEISDATGGSPFGYIVQNRYIRGALLTAARALPSLHILDRMQITHFSADDGGMQIDIASSVAGHPPQSNRENTLQAKLLIAAEGKHSPTRKQAGIKDMQWQYEQTAIVCTIAHEKPHHGLAQERFLPAGPFAVLPMQNNRSSLVWVEPNDRVEMYLELPEEEFIQEIAERIGGYLGKLQVEGNRFSYPLSLMHAKTYISERLALVGDAAHAIHPIAGQGINLGFRDVAVLSELLGEAFSRGQDIGTQGLLNHYQRWRRFDNITMLAVTDTLNRLFSNTVFPVRLARGIGLLGVSKLPVLKRFFMQHAMGIVGDVPKLAKTPKIS